jgi:hypothetical protein
VAFGRRQLRQDPGESLTAERKGLGGKDDLRKLRPRGLSPAARRHQGPAAAGVLANKPCELCVAVIPLQRVCGQSCRQRRRGRLTAGLLTGMRGQEMEIPPLRRLHPIDAACNPLTVLPSLPAHKTQSCRARSFGTWPALASLENHQTGVPKLRRALLRSRRLCSQPAARCFRECSLCHCRFPRCQTRLELLPGRRPVSGASA